jgi:hypothetical protein
LISFQVFKVSGLRCSGGFPAKWTYISKCPTFCVFTRFQWLLKLSNLWNLRFGITDARSDTSITVAMKLHGDIVKNKSGDDELRKGCLARNRRTIIDSSLERLRDGQIAVEQQRMIGSLLAQVQVPQVVARKNCAAQVTLPWFSPP